MIEIKIHCDVRNCPNQLHVKSITHNQDMKSCKLPSMEQVQVIFHSDQTAGRSCSPYLSVEHLHLCPSCKDKILKGNYLHGQGAMGYKEFWFGEAEDE